MRRVATPTSLTFEKREIVAETKAEIEELRHYRPFRTIALTRMTRDGIVRAIKKLPRQMRRLPLVVRILTLNQKAITFIGLP